MDGDRVRVREDVSKAHRRVGTVVEIIERAKSRVIGTVVASRGAHYVDASQMGISEPVWVGSADLSGAKDGDRVGVVLLEFPSEQSPELLGRVVQIFPPGVSVAAEVARVVFERRLRDEFPQDALDHAATLPDEVGPAEVSGREDLRHLPLVTIDGDDAKDFDDAVAIVPGDRKGQRVLYVAIADVAHYVEVETPIDREAQRRGTSVYFPMKVLPMLPEKLSNGLCSLRPDVDRLAVVTRMVLDAGDRVVDTSFHDAVIRSRARLTYKQVQRQLDGEAEGLPPEALRPMLVELRELAATLLARRIEAGSIDLELPEPWFELSADGEQVERVEARRRTEATSLIEELMLLANRHVAAALRVRDIPAVYRIHEEPDPDKLEKFLLLARVFTPDMRVKATDDSKAVQAVLDGAPADKRHALQSLLLRAMQRARYSIRPESHWGLGFSNYAHSTSPIRRYPDLIVQRLLKRHLIGGFSPPKAPDKLRKTLERLASESSHSEQQAQSASWDVDALLKARYMERHLGEEMDGRIMGMTPNGLFVGLGDLPIDGYLPVGSLPFDDYVFDDVFVAMRGGRTKKAFALGDRLRVVVVAADMVSRRIELGLPEVIAAAEARRRG
jgi:ribonuclease R